MRPVIDYPPEVLAYLRSGWILYRNNVHDRWRLARYRGDLKCFQVPDKVAGELERDQKIRPKDANEYELNE